jgi:hypothetical protein
VKIHLCLLDKECRNIERQFGGGITHRVELNFKRFHFGFAYLPGSRYALPQVELIHVRL